MIYAEGCSAPDCDAPYGCRHCMPVRCNCPCGCERYGDGQVERCEACADCPQGRWAPGFEGEEMMPVEGHFESDGDGNYDNDGLEMHP